MRERVVRQGWKIGLFFYITLLSACAVQSVDLPSQVTETAAPTMKQVATEFVTSTPSITDVYGQTVYESRRLFWTPTPPVSVWVVEPCISKAIPLEQTEPDLAPGKPVRPGPEQNGGQSEICRPNQLPETDSDLLLPDLTTLPPSDLRIRVDPVTGQKLLMFTNSIMNNGPGEMQLFGKVNPDTGKVTVTQRLVDTEVPAEDLLVGEFFFHPEHNHWHLGSFASYEIWSLGSEGELDSIMALSSKVSYCLRDDERADIPEASPRQSYTSCDQERQGISVGWVDIYWYHLDGQNIDITFLPDGVYALRSTVDPENRLWDMERENNSAVLYIEIIGERVKVIERSDA